jgi:hypothetical protein
MNLYTINVGHFAPKGSQYAIMGYVIAENDEQVYEYIKSEPLMFGEQLFNSWKEKEGSEEYPDFKSEMIKCGGELYAGIELEDLYYGVTQYGWELLKNDIDVCKLSYALEIGLLNSVTKSDLEHF